MRVRVSDVLDLFAAGLTAEELLEEMPDLEPEDLQACLRLALSRSSGAGGVILWVDAQLSPSLAPWITQEFGLEAVGRRVGRHGGRR